MRKMRSVRSGSFDLISMIVDFIFRLIIGRSRSAGNTEEHGLPEDRLGQANKDGGKFSYQKAQNDDSNNSNSSVRRPKKQQ